MFGGEGSSALYTPLSVLRDEDSKKKKGDRLKEQPRVFLFLFSLT